MNISQWKNGDRPFFSLEVDDWLLLTGVQGCDDVVPRLRAGPSALIVTLTPAHHYTSGTSVFTHTPIHEEILETL